MFHDLAIELIKKGHDIKVITPNNKQSKKLIKKCVNGVDVWYFKSGPIKNVNKITRAFNETCLSFRAWSAIKKNLDKHTFDGIIYYSPSIFFGGLVNKIKKKCNCPSYLVLRDSFPQWVIDAGILKENSFLARYFKFFEQYSYEAADTIGLMSEKNLSIFNESNSFKFNTEVLRNWADISPVILKDTEHISIRKSLKLENKIIFFYGGNIGRAQDMANLMRLVKKMKIYENAHFLFIGQGDEVKLINKLAKKWNLSNYSYLPSVNQNEFKKVLSEIDIGLFSLSPKHTAHNFPGKLLGYMQHSIPILGSVNSDNDLKELFNTEGAGLISNNGDDSQLLIDAELLYKDSALRENMGQRGHNLLIKEFSVTSIATNIVKSFKNNP